jgi:transcription-repair coupling factor (superfamily II helicase)
MYLDMLEQAVRTLRSGRRLGEPGAERPLAAVSEIELQVPALLPEAYVGDVHLRLALYQRIAGADAAALRDMTAELIDRFGALPPPADNLLRLARLRLAARALGVRRLELGPTGGSVQFEADNQVDSARVIELVRTQPREYRLEGPLKLRVTRALAQPEQRFAYAQRLLGQLGARELNA